jgi:hypothetical protein
MLYFGKKIKTKRQMRNNLQIFTVHTLKYISIHPCIRRSVKGEERKKERNIHCCEEFAFLQSNGRKQFENSFWHTVFVVK